MNKYFFGWGSIKKVILDLYATLGNDKSLLSSKRLERLILFWAAVSISICFVWYSRATITTTEIIMICTMLFTYGGFNTVMGHIAKKESKEAAQTDKIIEEKIPDKK